MAVQLPVVPSIPLYTFTSVIMGDTYIFTFRWNARDDAGKNADGTPRLGAWYFDVTEGDGTKILSSIKVVLGTLLGRGSTHPLLRGAGFFAVDTSGTLVEAGLDDLGTRVTIAHFTAKDILLSQAPAFEVPEE